MMITIKLRTEDKGRKGEEGGGYPTLVYPPPVLSFIYFLFLISPFSIYLLLSFSLSNEAFIYRDELLGLHLTLK